jgi:putative endopeptidase
MSNTYNTFEHKIEEVFKKNKVNIVSASYNLEKLVVNELKKAVNTKGVQPNQDFYSYINDRWITDYEITENQKYIVQIDDFRIIQDKVYRELIEIIEDYLKKNASSTSKKVKCIKNAYTSFKTYNTLQQTRQLSNTIVEHIDLLRKDKTNLWKQLGLANTNELISWGCPFVWSINPDDKNPTIYKCYLEPPQLTLIDIDVYFDDEIDTKEDKKYKTHYRKQYTNYLSELFTIAFGNNHGYNMEDVFNTEFEILNAMSCELITEVDSDGYNLITKEEALTNFGFNWTEFCKNLGFTKIPNSFVTSNINYLLCGTKLLLERWDSEQWKTYWIYLYIRQQCRWTEEGFKSFYNFQGSFAKGQSGNVDNYIMPIFSMGFAFNSFLTNEYITKYNNIDAINYVKAIAEDLKIVFSRIIKRNTWMQPSTKRKALKKLEKLKLIVGSPIMLRDDPLLDYKSDDPWGNISKIALWRHKQAITLVDKPIIDIPVIDWTQLPPKFVGTQAYVVNASYTATNNEIYIPLGYIQKPFVDLDERGLEYNLSRIGFTIAHEMLLSNMKYLLPMMESYLMQNLV